MKIVIMTVLDYEKARDDEEYYDEEYYDYDDCDYEVGYDPYLGCFSDDC